MKNNVSYEEVMKMLKEEIEGYHADEIVFSDDEKTLISNIPEDTMYNLSRSLFATALGCFKYRLELETIMRKLESL